MRWARWQSCIGGVALLFLMGCAGQQFSAVGLFQSAAAGDKGYVVAGSAESTALALQTSLKGLGVSAVATPQGDDIRIVSHTPKGDKFALVLTSTFVQNQGEMTRVRFEWE